MYKSIYAHIYTCIYIYVYVFVYIYMYMYIKNGGAYEIKSTVADGEVLVVQAVEDHRLVLRNDARVHLQLFRIWGLRFGVSGSWFRVMILGCGDVGLACWGL